MKKCPFCAEDIQDAAIVCRFCQRQLVGDGGTPPGATLPVSQRTWSPGTAAVLSFFVPGLGHLYKGKIANGLLFFVCTIAGYFILILPGLALHLFVIYDAYNGPSKEEEALKRLTTPVVALSPEEQEARRKTNARQTKKLLLIVGGLFLFALLAARFVPRPEPIHLSNSPGVITEDAEWGEKLRRMVSAAGKTCTTAGDPFHQGADSATGTNYWNIHCSEGESYVISLGKFDPRVESCEAAPRISGTRCFTTIGGK